MWLLLKYATGNVLDMWKIFNPPFPILKVGHLATPGCYSNVFNYNYN